MTTFDDVLVQRRSARLGALLARTDAPLPAMTLPAHLVPRPRRALVPWQLAAALALLIAGAAGVPPVRAWIVGRVRSVLGRVTGITATAPRPRPVPPAPAGTLLVGESGPVVVRVAMRQDAGGTLTIQPFSGNVAGHSPGNILTASTVGSDTGVTLAIFPDKELRIVNDRTSTASYVLGVPPSVTRIVLLIAQENQRVFNRPAGSDRFIVDLGVRTATPRTLKH